MRRLLNDGWDFVRLEADTPAEAVGDLPAAAWQPVDLPHDWLIWNADALYEDGDGWYRRTLDVPGDFAERDWLLRFDGVYMDCDVRVNGAVVATHRYGYTAFDVDLTPALRPGENLLEVYVRHRAPNSRWYSGAGIFRDVTLLALPKRRVAQDGLYARCRPEADGGWRVDVEAELTGPGRGGALTLRLLDAAGEAVDEARAADAGERIELRLRVAEPKLWRPGAPHLYTLVCEFGEQRIVRRVGLRQTAFDPDRGFLLNGEPLKLHGVCLHHDLGALGAAFNAAAFRRQLRLMKRMGVNALRTSHNPPASAALDICDEEGVLVADELYDMWELPKTKYDNARFFPEHWREDVRAWIRRDRNHPCVVMWSIGNEIFDTHVSPRGAEVTAMLRDEARRHDPEGNAAVTLGSNYMPWEGAQRCADLVKVAGYNYAEKYYADHHSAHPDWVIYGSETSSILFSRGVYHFPRSANVISEEDMQCSALGNSTTSWGAQDMRRLIIDDLNTPYTLGQFLWSGTDYIGEPTPYKTRSCYFGMADTAGFEKDAYYQVKALWNPEPMAHIGVSWDWNAGQMIDVPVYTNGASCELFLNGVSLGRKAVNLRVPEESLPVWRLPYAAGELVAVARDAEGREIARDAVSGHGDSARLVLRAERTELRADGEDMAFVTVCAVDAQGRPVRNACDRVRVRVEGPARLMGLDNGDSADRDGYKVSSRCLFGGKLLIMIGATDAAGEALVRVESDGPEGAALALRLIPAEGRPGHSCRQRVTALPAGEAAIPARRIDLKRLDGAPGVATLTPERPEARFAARLLPAGAAAQPIRYHIVNALGIPSPCAEAVETEDGVLVRGRGDGEIWLRAVCDNGYPHARVISQLELKLEGFGQPGLDPYGFITGGLYDISAGEITSGNEKGIAFARDGASMAGFTRVNFGPVGSDEITIPIFELGGEPVDITLWMGDPRKDGHVVDVLHYHKKSVWNTYQAQTWKLPERFVGERIVAFSLSSKVHMKGFSFARQSRAWLPLNAAEADEIYGDSYRLDGGAVRNIGNNVSLVFREMDFGERRRVRLAVRGRTPLAVNPIQLRLEGAAGQTSAECRFLGDGPAEQVFDVETPGGLCTATFVFLPGCQFDFEGLRFAAGDGAAVR